MACASSRTTALATASPRGFPGCASAQSAVDTQTVADHFELGRFATAGVSGGGPHVLAAAALLPDRVVAAAVVAGDAPFDAEGLDWFDGMGDLNTEERDVMQQGEEAYQRLPAGAGGGAGREHAGRAAGGHGQPALAGRQRQPSQGT